MKELKTMGENQLLHLAYSALLERIFHEEINERTKKTLDEIIPHVNTDWKCIIDSLKKFVQEYLRLNKTIMYNIIKQKRGIQYDIKTKTCNILCHL